MTTRRFNLIRNEPFEVEWFEPAPSTMRQFSIFDHYTAYALCCPECAIVWCTSACSDLPARRAGGYNVSVRDLMRDTPYQVRARYCSECTKAWLRRARTASPGGYISVGHVPGSVLSFTRDAQHDGGDWDLWSLLLQGLPEAQFQRELHLLVSLDLAINPLAAITAACPSQE